MCGIFLISLSLWKVNCNCCTWLLTNSRCYVFCSSRQLRKAVIVQAWSHLQTCPCCCVCPTNISSSLTQSETTSYAACPSLTWIPRDSIKFPFIWPKRKQFWHHTVNIPRLYRDLQFCEWSSLFDELKSFIHSHSHHVSADCLSMLFSLVCIIVNIRLG